MQEKEGKQTTKQDPLPKMFYSISEAAAFWEDHDSADYEEIMESVDFDIDIKRRVYLIPVAGSIFGDLRKKAKAEGLSTETLVNLLLQEQVTA
ncbi:MAG: hypothetical protein JRE64_04145 [Deltaproteobacteria bacterium]|nr:hypothetical protein [Deltaproteobacteria bacterium]